LLQKFRRRSRRMSGGPPSSFDPSWGAVCRRGHDSQLGDWPARFSLGVVVSMSRARRVSRPAASRVNHDPTSSSSSSSSSRTSHHIHPQIARASCYFRQQSQGSKRRFQDEAAWLAPDMSHHRRVGEGSPKGPVQEAIAMIGKSSWEMSWL